MIKWPWKANHTAALAPLPWEAALAIPLLAGLSDEQQQKLVRLSERFYSRSGWCPYRVLSWMS